MAEKEPPIFKDTMSPEELQGWLREEIRDSAKAHELRTKDATDFVTAYASGKLTPEEAMDHLYRYDQRWGEALYGTTASAGLSDEEILGAIDRAREEALYPDKIRHAERIDRKAQEPGEQSR